MICVSAFTARDVVDRYGVDEDKVRVVHNAPSLAIGSDPVPERAPYVLGIGDLRAKKNWRRLAEASPLPVVIAGVDCGEGKALRDLGRRAHGVGGRRASSTR